MILQPLLELQTEINRLIIAGSRFANNDPRLQKLLPVFEKMGGKAPVFKKIADNIEALLKAPKTGNAEHLTALSTLLYAVLYTQGKNIVEGEITAQSPMMNIDEVKTPLTYLELQPTIEALTTTGSGRYEIINDAFNRGLIHDVRLYAYIARGIEDKYSEIADFVKSDIIPAIGAPLIPFLLQDFEYVDNKANALRIEILDELGYSLPDDMIQTIMNGNDAKLQVALIPSLSRDEQYLPLLFDAAKSKKKATKEAALIGLARLQTTEAWDFIMAAFRNPKSKFSLDAFAAALSPLENLQNYEDEFIESLKNHINELFNFDWQDDSKKSYDLFGIISRYIEIFYHKRNETVTNLLIDFSHKIQSQNINKVTKDYYYQSSFNTLQINIGIYIANLNLAENDPMFDTTLKAIHFKNNDAKEHFISPFYAHYKYFSPAFIYRVFTYFLETENTLDWANSLYFLTTTHEPLFLAYKINNGYVELYSDHLMIPNEKYADPRWADYLYDYCVSEHFLTLLQTSFIAGHNYLSIQNAMRILSFLNALEPKDSTRMDNLLKMLLSQLHSRHLMSIFAYLDHRMGNLSHPMILEKIEHELQHINPSNTVVIAEMNSIKQRILAQSQPE